MSRYEQIDVDAPAQVVVTASARSCARGVTEYTVVDHGRDIDIPLRLAVIATARTRSAIVLRPMSSLIGDEHPELAARFTAMLHALADRPPRLEEAVVVGRSGILPRLEVQYQPLDPVGGRDHLRECVARAAASPSLGSRAPGPRTRCRRAPRAQRSRRSSGAPAHLSPERHRPTGATIASGGGRPRSPRPAWLRRVRSPTAACARARPRRRRRAAPRP